MRRSNGFLPRRPSSDEFGRLRRDLCNPGRGRYNGVPLHDFATAMTNDANAGINADQDDHLRVLIESLPDPIIFKDGDGRWRVVNKPGLRLFGLLGCPWEGKTDLELSALYPHLAVTLNVCKEDDEKAWACGTRFDCLEYAPDPDSGEMQVFEITKVPLFHPDGSRRGLVTIGRNVTERKKAEAEIHRLAYFDVLTDLPNRRMMEDRLNQGLAQAQRYHRPLAVLFIDLDFFKNINDSLGHHAGDALLVEVAQRLRTCVRAGDTVSRSGGDEFIIILTEITSVQDAEVVAEKILHLLQQPMEILGNSIRIGASIGIAVHPVDDPDDVQELMIKADKAMYEAKNAGRNRYSYFR